MAWCGKVWHGMVQRRGVVSAVWCGVVVWFDGVLWQGVMWCGGCRVVKCGMVYWLGMMVWCGKV